MIESWIFSMIPVGIAFTFYIVAILFSSMEPKGLFIAYGAAAGFVGLESYWIMRGVRQRQFVPIVMGVIGIALTALLLYGYLKFTDHLPPLPLP
ncbi:hypothetical protein D5085_18015 [Ectothiorhodospiraceae bacterium BW-2]|nr:hypothetical protein D5085_18015 [Ectothiorhodospiraceae bacterium BW-2]